MGGGMLVSGSCDVRHRHVLADIAGYVVVRVHTQPAAAYGPCGTVACTNLAVLEGAGQYQRARELAHSLNAANAGSRIGFRVEAVYTDGCCMPW